MSLASTSSSRMHVMNHNWSATKQRLHPRSVTEISCHSVLSGDRIRQCETSSGSRHKNTALKPESHCVTHIVTVGVDNTTTEIEVNRELLRVIFLVRVLTNAYL